ncbi:MAG TPA: glycosyltransferase [Solirubrobacteraceae bacterium]|nr:glycosyltransferase [Solirubrobacteraceae bacterium]
MRATDHGPPASGHQGTRLRVLTLVDKLKVGGGAERAAVALATHLPRDRFDVTVATTRPSGGPLLASLRGSHVRYMTLDRRHRFDMLAFRRLFAVLREERIDVLHAHMFGSNVWGSIFGRVAGVPAVIAHEHTWSYEGQPVRRFLDGRVIGRLVDAFVCVSERDRDRMIELEGVPPGKIVLLPNPYVPRPSANGGDARAQLGIEPHAPLITTVTVLRPQKALEVLIDAFAQVSRSLPDTRLVIAGNGPRREALEQHARDLGVSDRVRFPGWWDDVSGLLRTADVAAMSSDYEGSPLFGLECMAHGIPLVSTDVGNIGTVLGEGVTLVPPRDAAALAAALEGLLRDPARRAAQAAAAATRLSRYHIDNVALEFGALYERIVAENRQRRRTER